MKLVIDVRDRTLRRALSMAAVLGSLGLAYFVGAARADGIPTGETLFYSGVAEDDGVPVDGTRAVVVELFDSASGGTAQCTTSSDTVVFTAGAFRLPLSNTCVAAVHAHPNLYAQVSIAGTTLPRSKLGAVPYSLEAERAATAATADDADLLDGADSSAFASAVHPHAAGAITSGALAPGVGGTGLSGLGSNGNRLLGANAASNAFELKALNGTTGQVAVAHSASAITLSLGGGVPHNCSRHETSTATSSTTVDCPVGKLVLGGGGACAPSNDQGTATENRMKYTRPASDRSGWVTVCTVTDGSKATWSYAICCEE